MYILQRFGATALPGYDASSDIGVAPVDLRTFPLATGGVYDPLGSNQAASRGMTIIDRSSFVGQTAAELEADVLSMRALVGVRDKLIRMRDSGAFEWIYARLLKCNAIRRPANVFSLDVELEFAMHSAVWNGERHGDGWLLDSGEYLDTSLVVDEETGDKYRLYAGTTNLTITNGGNAPVKNAILTITAANVAITGLTITKSGETHLVYAGMIAAGNSLVIDCGEWSVKNNAVDDYANFSFGANHAIDGMLTLDPGANVLQIIKTGGNINDTLTIEFYDGWQ